MITRLCIVSVVIACLVLLNTGSAFAIPALARREGVTCQMCHFCMPELNKDGHDYVRRELREEPPSLEMKMESKQKEKKPEIPADIGRPAGVPLNLQ